MAETVVQTGLYFYPKNHGPGNTARGRDHEIYTRRAVRQANYVQTGGDLTYGAGTLQVTVAALRAFIDGRQVIDTSDGAFTWTFSGAGTWYVMIDRTGRIYYDTVDTTVVDTSLLLYTITTNGAGVTGVVDNRRKAAFEELSVADNEYLYLSGDRTKHIRWVSASARIEVTGTTRFVNRVGIGDVTATSALHIKGANDHLTIETTSGLAIRSRLGTWFQENTWTLGYNLADDGTVEKTGRAWRMQFTQSQFYIAASAGTVTGGAVSNLLEITSAGNVGIGGAPSITAGLDVRSTISSSTTVVTGANFRPTLTMTVNSSTLTAAEVNGPTFIISGAHTSVNAYGFFAHGGTFTLTPGSGSFNIVAAVAAVAPTGGTSNYAFYAQSGNSMFNGSLGLGGAPQSNERLLVGGLIVATSWGKTHALRIATRHQAEANGNPHYGLLIQSLESVTATFTGASLTGILVDGATFTTSGTGTTTTAYGIYITAPTLAGATNYSIYASGGIMNFAATQFIVNGVTTGSNIGFYHNQTVTASGGSGYGLLQNGSVVADQNSASLMSAYFAPTFNVGAFTGLNSIVLRVGVGGKTGTGTIANAYALHIDGAPSYGTNNYAFYVNGGTSYFGGKAGFGASIGDISGAADRWITVGNGGSSPQIDIAAVATGSGAIAFWSGSAASGTARGYIQYVNDGAASNADRMLFQTGGSTNRFAIDATYGVQMLMSVSTPAASNIIANGFGVFVAESNTSVKLYYKGTDGVLRSVAFTLA